MSRKFGFALSTAVMATVFVTAPAHAATTAIEFGKLPGTTEQEAAAINDAGVAVGNATVGGKVRAVKWGVDGTATDLGGPAEWPAIKAKAINSSGVVAAEASGENYASVAVRFNLDGTHTVLSQVPGAIHTTVTGIDDAGTVYGWGVDRTWLDTWRAVRWDANGVQTPLQVPEGTRASQVDAASPNGYATGWVDMINQPLQGVRWNPDGSFTLLQALPGGGDTAGQGVNRHGDVVGRVDQGSVATSYTVRWNRDGSMTKLGAQGYQMSINDSRVVVTVLRDRPVRWNAAGEQSTFAWPAGEYFGELMGINSDGVIVGFTGVHSLFDPRAFKWVVS